MAYPWELRYDDGQDGEEVDGEIHEVVMGIMSAEKEKNDWNAEEELLRWRVLVAIVDLFPHVQIVVGTGVELKRYSSDPVKHQV